ncbi:MAG TPA: GDSL-type esterase/lipase family protein [Panacibacter sp.]|nr:GDSL-type esterase/lipase family protein [Panacibacter sp.]
MTGELILVLAFIGLLILISFMADKSNKKKIIFFGDSITQAGLLLKGYITVMKHILHQQGIENYDLIGAGTGGNKVYDLYLRLDEDVLSKSPYIVVIYIGVNDVWHKKTHGTGTDPGTFENFYRAIISKLHINGAKVIMCTPAVIGERKDYGNEMDDDLNKYCNIIRNMAASLKVPLVDLRKAFTDYEAANNTANADKEILTTDGVHLNDAGNVMVAGLMWNVIKDVK